MNVRTTRTEDDEGWDDGGRAVDRVGDAYIFANTFSPVLQERES